MVCVQVSCDGGAAQWAMIELQGEVERKDGGTLAQAFDVGTMTASTSVSVQWGAWLGARAPPLPGSAHRSSGPYLPACLLQGSVVLNIGYHQLEGQRVALKKPLAVLEKVAGEGEGQSTEYKASPRRSAGGGALAAAASRTTARRPGPPPPPCSPCSPLSCAAGDRRDAGAIHLQGPPPAAEIQARQQALSEAAAAALPGCYCAATAPAFASCPAAPPFFPLAVGRRRSCLDWLSCKRCVNSVSVSARPQWMSAVPNTASSCASTHSCGRRGGEGGGGRGVGTRDGRGPQQSAAARHHHRAAAGVGREEAGQPDPAPPRHAPPRRHASPAPRHPRTRPCCM